jgi:hypothetical protein
MVFIYFVDYVIKYRINTSATSKSIQVDGHVIFSDDVNIEGLSLRRRSSSQTATISIINPIKIYAFHNSITSSTSIQNITFSLLENLNFYSSFIVVVSSLQTLPVSF